MRYRRRGDESPGPTPLLDGDDAPRPHTSTLGFSPKSVVLILFVGAMLLAGLLTYSAFLYKYAHDPNSELPVDFDTLVIGHHEAPHPARVAAHAAVGEVRAVTNAAPASTTTTTTTTEALHTTRATVQVEGCTWLTDALPGRCWGLTVQTDRNYTSGAECQRECCAKGDACITWQYHPRKGCVHGPVVRLGNERTDTPDWCEPSAPRPWSGLKLGPELREKVGDTYRCRWDEAEPRNTQCFGFGPEVTADGGKRLTEADCRDNCCNEPMCAVWQWREDKGCFRGFYNGNSDNCDADNDPWEGSRKPWTPPPKTESAAS